MRLPPSYRLAHPLARHTFTSHARLSNGKSSMQHQDIQSFIQYAESASLSPETTVYVGTLYEYTVLAALSSLRMTLEHCGGKGDRGIDLRGTWNIPKPSGESSDTPRIIPVVVSCKAHKAKSGPERIRELEGALGSSSRDTIGILATVSTCTPGATRQMLLSQRALAYCYVKPYADGGQVQQLVWNNPAGVLLQGLGARIKYTPGKGGVREGVVLTLDGQVLSSKVGKSEGK